MADIVAKHAPLVVLHADDKLRPSSAEWFIGRSELRWATGRALDGEPVPDVHGELDAARLGAAGSSPYRFGRFTTSELTRPLDDNAARHGDPPLAEGFFLRLREEAFARGDKGTSNDPSAYAGTTAYSDYDADAKAITYWLFYAGSSPPLGILRAGEQIGTRGAPTDEVPDELEAADAAAKLEEFQRAYPGLAFEAEPRVRTRALADVVQRLRVVAEGVRALLRKDDVLHEGDWERITVYLDETAPETAPPAFVGYYRHSTNTFKPWAGVEKRDGTHPVVYSAIGSHASLPSPDFGFIDVGDPDGPRWRTWEQVVSIADQPWYGFGGAWGRLGKVRDSTGPLGPGAHWKHAAARPAAPSSSR